MFRCIVCGDLLKSDEEINIRTYGSVLAGTCGKRCQNTLNLRLQFLMACVEDAFLREQVGNGRPPLDTKAPSGLDLSRPPIPLV